MECCDTAKEADNFRKREIYAKGIHSAKQLFGSGNNLGHIFYNRMISEVMVKLKPNKMSFILQPQNDSLRIFGCCAFECIRKYNRRSKLGDQAEVSGFLGIENDLYR